jgi:hypothetical protein
MFVKFKSLDNRESIYQCDRFFLTPHPESSLGEISLEADTPPPNGSCIHIGELDLTTVSIFVMNDQGRTIETYWARPKTGQSA